MHTRTQSSPSAKNRATGYTDADWGQLEKRLSDTRDLLRDILSHLRRVLDNLKTAGARYEGAGRASRQKSAYQPGDARRQQGYRPQGATAGTRRPYAASADHTTSAGARFTTGTTAGATPGAASGAASSARANASSSTAGRTAGPTASQSRTGDSFREKAYERKPEGGFSWSARGAGQAGASAQAGNARFAGQASSDQTGSSQAGASTAGERKTTFGDWRTGQSARPNAGGAGRAAGASAGGATAGERTFGDWRTGQNARPNTGGANSGGDGATAGDRSSTFGGWRTNQNTRANTGSAGAGNAGDGHYRQSAGAGQRPGASGQSTGKGAGDSYRQQARKPAPRPGMMTLTNACALLCLSYPCTPDEIKAAYRKQARRHHPDLGGDEEMMKSINQAYETALSWCNPLRGKSGVWAA